MTFFSAMPGKAVLGGRKMRKFFSAGLNLCFEKCMTPYFKTVDWKSASSIALFWVSFDLFKKDFNITSPADNAVALFLLC